MSHTAVVILNYNGEKFLRQFLPAVIEHSGKAEIIVADNASTDDSYKIIRQFPSIRLIPFDKNYGFCGGYNRALRQVEADYYVLLNSDVEVTANWLTPLISLLEKNKSIAAVQPKILSYNHRNQFEYAGAGGGFIDSLGYPFCRGRIFKSLESDLGQYNDEIEIFWATGACLVVRAELYHKFEGLDEDFFAHMEEIDLCWKLQRAFYKIYYCGKSTVYHVGAGTLGYESPRKTYLNFRNGLTLIYKHFTKYQLLTNFPARIILDWIAALTFLLKGQLANCKAVFNAHRSFLKDFSKIQRKRQALQQLYPFYSRGHIYRGSILFDYYVKGRKRYQN